VSASGRPGSARAPIEQTMNDRVSDLIGDYVYYLDMSLYDDWLALFVETAVYKIMPRDNLDLGLPAPLMFCKNKNMIRDRIKTFREVNKYNIHSTRHLVGRPRLAGIEDAVVAAEVSFAVYQTNQEGVTHLFGTGSYLSRFRRNEEELLFEEQVVKLDTFSVPTLLADPI
jgi:anthranilate 1,2-dioxygenase small subunit